MHAMSEVSTSKPAAEKSAPKASSESAETSTDSAAAATSSDSAAASTSSESASSTTRKSSRESVGGKTEVHYGYFSNVKTPEYRSGWDGIWGARTENREPKNGTATRRARPKSPVRLSLAFDDLPEPVRDELLKAAGAALKAASRLDFARREKAGAVSWSIECEVRR